MDTSTRGGRPGEVGVWDPRELGSSFPIKSSGRERTVRAGAAAGSSTTVPYCMSSPARTTGRTYDRSQGSPGASTAEAVCTLVGSRPPGGPAPFAQPCELRAPWPCRLHALDTGFPERSRPSGQHGHRTENVHRPPGCLPPGQNATAPSPRLRLPHPRLSARETSASLRGAARAPPRDIL